MDELIHFFSFDDRFCGTKEAPRRVSFDPNEITCPRCAERDTFELSPQAIQFVESLNGEAQ